MDQITDRTNGEAAASGADTRLIERWLPIAALGEESVRERRFSLAGKMLPPNNSLHVWWARRPLIASRAAVLASLLPAGVAPDTFLEVIGILGDPVAARRRNDSKLRAGQTPLGEVEYGYPRAFRHALTKQDREALRKAGIPAKAVVLDPTAGGGAIPFEAARLGMQVLANDLNPVAALIEKATIEYPLKFGGALIPTFADLAREFIAKATPRFEGLFPPEAAGTQILGYQWARTIRCPYCDGLVPLSPNWRLAPGGVGVRLKPSLGTGPGDQTRLCEFEIVAKESDQSKGTVSDGDGTCPFPDCERVIGGDEIKKQAQANGMGEQLFAIVYKKRTETKTKAGKRGREKWVRGYRSPTAADDNLSEIARRLNEKMEEWSALDFVPNEAIGDLSNYDRGHRMYGMQRWADFFSPRQLLGHGIGVEVFRELLSDRERKGTLDEITKAAFVYLSISLDKLLDYNSRMTRWHSIREVIVNTFDSHNFAHRWSFTEIAPVMVGGGYDWVIGQVATCIEELVALCRPDTIQIGDLLSNTNEDVSIEVEAINITSKPGNCSPPVRKIGLDTVTAESIHGEG
jgi:adenine-specific DNA methylase